MAQDTKEEIGKFALEFLIAFMIIFFLRDASFTVDGIGQSAVLAAGVAGLLAGLESGQESEEEREGKLKEKLPDKEEKNKGMPYQQFIYLRPFLALIAGFLGITLLGTIFTSGIFIFTPAVVNSTLLWNIVGWILGCFFIGFIIYYPIEKLWLKFSFEDKKEKED